jgi:hypothetical protein
MMRQLREAVPYEEFDYQVLLDALREYRKPRDKISQLLASGEIIRVKKGIYVFGQPWRRGLISTEVLANLISGPSYISREFALAHYGLIPERVHEITSMSRAKSRTFDTPLGRFSYTHLSLARYRPGVTLRPLDSRRSCFFATPEKALADTLYLQPHISTRADMLEHLQENMRIERDDLAQLDVPLLKTIATAYHRHNVTLLAKAMATL